MKSTKQKLQFLIKETVTAHRRADLGKNIADAEFPIVVGYGGKSEIAYDQEELDNILDAIAPTYGPGTGIKHSLDSLRDLEPEDVPVGAHIEQFTEDHEILRDLLRQIIKEEMV